MMITLPGKIIKPNSPEYKELTKKRADWAYTDPSKSEILILAVFE